MPRRYSKLQEEELYVSFDRPQPIYHPCETVSGTLVCNFADRHQNVTGIVLKCRGKGQCVITKTQAGGPGGQAQTQTYRAKHYYLKEDVVLYDAEAISGGCLEAGRLEIPFSFTLPEDCPPSFSYGAELGKVVYYVRAKVHEPKPLHKKFIPVNQGRNKVKYGKYGMFVVTPHPDRPLPTSASLPVEKSKTAKAGGLLGLVGGKPIHCTARLESGTGLRFGNTAVVSVSVDNQSKSKVDGIRATLIHDMYFSASAFEERVQIVMAKTPKICCKKTDRQPVRPYSEMRAELELRLPQTLPYTHPDNHSGRIQPLPRGTIAKLDKQQPYSFAWPYSHHPSPTADPDDIWLVKKNVASKYFVEVKFNIKNSTSSARIRIPVTVHAGVSAADIFGSGGSDAEDDNLSVHDALDDKAAVL